VNTRWCQPIFQNSLAEINSAPVDGQYFAQTNIGRLFAAITMALCLTNFW
jgi:hypothetical protein